MTGSENFVYLCKSDVSAVQGHPRSVYNSTEPSIVQTQCTRDFVTDRRTDRQTDLYVVAGDRAMRV